MIPGLGRFVAALRREGVAVSPAEWIDAVRAVAAVGLEDRGRFRAALRAAMVKRARHRPAFDRLFESFFAPPGRSGGCGERRGAGGGGGEGRKRAAPAREAGSGRGVPLPAQPAAGRDRRPPFRSREDRERAERLRRRLERARDGGPRREGRLRSVILAAPAAGQVAGPHEGPRPDPLRRDLRARLSPDEERELAEALPRVIERIRLRPGRRQRRSRTGRLYMRRVFRENLAHGGVPFRLPRRALRPRRARVVLLVDVSWSTSRAAALFLHIACEFLRPGSGARVVFFVDRPVEATAEVESWLRRPRGRSFETMLRALPDLNLDAPSDYGRLFHRLARAPRRPRGRDTLLVVLGDGRTNYLDPQAWALDEVAGGCAATLWLVPEPRPLWGTGDSALPAYLPHVNVAVETHDLAGLARGVTELLRAL